MDFASLRAKAQQAAAKGQQSATDLYKNHKSQQAPTRSDTSSSSYGAYNSPSTVSAAPSPKPPLRSSTLSPPASSTPPPRTFPSLPDNGPSQKVDWLNISRQEKQAFFNLLDQYFDRHRGVETYQSTSSNTSSQDSAPPAPPEWARPASKNTAFPSTPSAFTSFPPPSHQESAAADFACYFRDPASWTSQWYSGGQRMPPVLANRDDFTFSASMTSLGSKATLVGSVLFSDLSMANYSVAWDTSQGRAAPPHASVAILNRPASLAAAVLTAAYETHSESIAQFAEQAVHSGRPVARGECWDLADSALKTLDQYDVPKVVPSLSRCHGHLIFEGKAGAQGQEGLWRGGDTEIRRGDIVEWRKVTIAEVGMPSSAWSTLGNPDHTAVILSAAQPSTPVSDGSPVPPSAFAALDVAEQSQGQPPKRVTYDLTRMSAGEMWVYRPIGIEIYLGRDMLPEWPADGMHVVV